MWPNPQFPADFVTFTEEIFNGKLFCVKCYIRFVVFYLFEFNGLLFVVLSCCLLGKMFFKHTGRFTEFFVILKSRMQILFGEDIHE